MTGRYKINNFNTAAKKIRVSVVKLRLQMKWFNLSCGVGTLFFSFTVFAPHYLASHCKTRLENGAELLVKWSITLVLIPEDS